MDNFQKSIIIINPFGIGDVIFTTPLIDSIKKKYSKVSLSYLCNKRTAPIVSSHPDIDKVFVFEKDQYRELWKKSKVEFIKKFFNFFCLIRKEHFDIALDFSLSRDYGFFSMMAGIKQRIGYQYKKRGLFLTDKIMLEDGFCKKHVIDYHREFLPFLKISLPLISETKVYISDQDQEKADQILKEKAVDIDKGYLCIMPGAGASWGASAGQKRWPVESFTELALKILKLKMYQIVLLGSSDEKKLCDHVQERVPEAINLSGKLDLMVYAGILKKSRLLITNDGGPLHMAVAVEVKTISIFGPVDEKVYGPYSSQKNRHAVIRSNVTCRPCYKKFRLPECSYDKRCLTEITVDEVFAVAQMLLAN